MANALIYSPSLHGHRQVHVFVYSQLLKELGFTIFIANDYKEFIPDSFYIDKLANDKKIIFKDTNRYAEGGRKISSEECIKLQKECNADLTIFTEADNHISVFTSQVFNKKKKLIGKNAGLFFRPFYLYRKLTFTDRLRYINHLPSSWRGDDYLFHEHLLKRFNLLRTAFYLDENFVSRHKYTRLLPDVFQSYADLLVKDQHPEQRVWIDRLNDFKKTNEGKFIFFYFGTSQKRRGYDLLLNMAVKENACFVHCGLIENSESYDFNVPELKNELKKKGMLFETKEYISDPLCIEYFFKSVDRLILPYKEFYGSSGVMLQALSYNIPVLVYENGIMGYLVKKYNLGLTYKNETTSLSKEFTKFKNISIDSFTDSIKSYMKSQSPEELKKRLVDLFNDCIEKKEDIQSA